MEVEHILLDCDQIVKKCEQYWNEHNIPESEVHEVLACIRNIALRIKRVLERTNEPN